jgi:signal peptidase I
MSGRKSAPQRTPAETVAAAPRPGSSDGTRETVEHIVIAFILAFVFKTFQAEAYVIPTGSMAPTLYGRHKEVVCTQCGYRYTIGASHEIDQESGVLLRHGRIETAYCTNCRHEDKVRDSPAFNGDRILVNKQVSEYRRFHVIVFKNPEEPHVNYIKRLVGLPGETVRIRRGDIYAKKAGTNDWNIQRKEDPERQKDIQLTVYDDRFPPTPLIAAGGEPRWAPCVINNDVASPSIPDRTAPSPIRWQTTENAWKSSAESGSYSVDSTSGEAQWLRYRHLVPTSSEWNRAENGQKLSVPLQPSLVLDFCGFNEDGFQRDIVDRELYWVPDLTVNATIKTERVSTESRLTFELVESARSYQCEFLPATGMVECYLKTEGTDERKLIGKAETSVRDVGEWSVSFANVDKRLCLWVDGQLIDLGPNVVFDDVPTSGPSNADLSPVGVSAQKLAATVSDLLIQRDIYYRNDSILFREEHGTTGAPGGFTDTRHISEVPPDGISALTESARFPEIYARRYADLTARNHEQFGDVLDYVLDDDEYLMCGDNSPASKDSRLFDYFGRPMRGHGGHRHAVRQSDLIGEALWIFWPHGRPFLNGGEGFSILGHQERKENGEVVRSDYPLYRFPFYPDFSRMKKIR